MREQDKQLLVDHYLDFYQIAFNILRNQTDVEDVVQDALVKTMSQPMLRDPILYCSKIVRNNCIKLLQDCAYSLPRSLPDPASTEEETDAEIRIQQLWRLKDQLPPRIQKVLNLYYVNGYSREQIAERTSMTLTTVNKLIHIGHSKLRKQMLNIEQLEQKDNNKANNI